MREIERGGGEWGGGGKPTRPSYPKQASQRVSEKGVREREREREKSEAGGWLSSPDHLIRNNRFLPQEQHRRCHLVQGFTSEVWIPVTVEPGYPGVTSLITIGGVPGEQKLLKEHLPRVIYHRVYQCTKKQDPNPVQK